MKTVERILIKLVIVQFTFLFLSQILFHQMDIFPQIKHLARYEGVNNSTFTEILQTFQKKNE
ncbi:YpfB family protein [Bacillus sp. USDA818B3_A]|uniref:YpfB family protein n=1 Tax=Bacillus sp. USDA818B3_A TaxID=2698834 RepID=UPI0013694422|nr:YpfB family protein [Bacillus sp. USDA818B3_A]